MADIREGVDLVPGRAIDVDVQAVAHDQLRLPVAVDVSRERGDAVPVEVPRERGLLDERPGADVVTRGLGIGAGPQLVERLERPANAEELS